jgi:hypothetical protein
MSSQSLAKNLEPTERGAGDALLVLCAHALLDVAQRTGHRRWLLDAIVALELGVQVPCVCVSLVACIFVWCVVLWRVLCRVVFESQLTHCMGYVLPLHQQKYSAFNFQFKFLLSRLYSHPQIGAAQRAAAHYHSLEPRYIQLDTTSHVVGEELVRCGLMADAQQMWGGVHAFYRTHLREVGVCALMRCVVCFGFFGRREGRADALRCLMVVCCVVSAGAGNDYDGVPQQQLLQSIPLHLSLFFPPSPTLLLIPLILSLFTRRRRT